MYHIRLHIITYVLSHCNVRDWFKQPSPHWRLHRASSAWPLATEPPVAVVESPGKPSLNGKNHGNIMGKDRKINHKYGKT